MCLSVVEPAAPAITSFSISSSNPTMSLDLAWTENNNNVASVKYKVRLDTGDGVNIKPVVDAVTGAHTFTGLVPGESNTAVLWAVTGDGFQQSVSVSSLTIYTSKVTLIKHVL